MNRALLASGLVDRLEVMVFPVITGESGSDPILSDLPDIDLELVDTHLFDGRTQQLCYVPTVRTCPWDRASSASGPTCTGQTFTAQPWIYTDPDNA